MSGDATEKIRSILETAGKAAGQGRWTETLVDVIWPIAEGMIRDALVVRAAAPKMDVFDERTSKDPPVDS